MSAWVVSWMAAVEASRCRGASGIWGSRDKRRPQGSPYCHLITALHLCATPSPVQDAACHGRQCCAADTEQCPRLHPLGAVAGTAAHHLACAQLGHTLCDVRRTAHRHRWDPASPLPDNRQPEAATGSGTPKWAIGVPGPPAATALPRRRGHRRLYSV